MGGYECRPKLEKEGVECSLQSRVGRCVDVGTVGRRVTIINAVEVPGPLKHVVSVARPRSGIKRVPHSRVAAPNWLGGVVRPVRPVQG
jgi:hypothetical protein